MAEQIKQRILLEGADKIQAQLEAIGKAGSEAFKKLQEASKAVGTVGAEDKLKAAVAAVQQYNKALQDTQKQVSQTGSSSENASNSVTKLSGAFRNVSVSILEAFGASNQTASRAVNLIVSAFESLPGRIGRLAGPVGLALAATGAVINKFSSDASANIQRLSEFSQKTGASVEGLQKFEAAARRVGVSSDELSKAVQKVGVELDTAKTKGAQAPIEIARSLGLLQEASSGTAKSIELVGRSLTVTYGEGSRVVKITRTIAEDAAEKIRVGANSLNDYGKAFRDFGVDVTRVQDPVSATVKLLEGLAKETDLAVRRNRARELNLDAFLPLLNDKAKFAEFLKAYDDFRLKFSENEKKTADNNKTQTDRIYDQWKTLTENLGRLAQNSRLGQIFDGVVGRFADAIERFNKTNIEPRLQESLNQQRSSAQPIQPTLTPPVETVKEYTDAVTAGSQILFNIPIEDYWRRVGEAAKQAAEQQRQAAEQQKEPLQVLGETLLTVALDTYANLEDIWNRLPELFSFDAISAEFDAFVSGLSDVWQNILQQGDEAAEYLKEAFGNIWDGIANAARTAWDGVSQIISNSVGTILSSLRGFVDTAISVLGGLLNRALAIASRIASAIQSAFSSSTPVEGSTMDGFAPPELATGGYIRGRGTSTSDSILARLSNGEFVMRAAAVRKFGPSFFAALNSLRLPQFATGGLVQAMAMPQMSLSPSFELPGSGPSLRPLAVTIGGETFQMMAPEDTAQSLMRFATVKQIRSNGRKPSWHGG